MKLAYSNKYFWLAIAGMILQQVFVGASTYVISLAGRAVGGDTGAVLFYIILFFGFVLVAYILGSSALAFCQKSANVSWLNYYEALFRALRTNFQFNTPSNRSRTNAWVTGEALSSFDEAASFLVDMVAVYCNILFTTAVFFFALSPRIGITLLGSLVVSFGLVLLSNRRVKAMADGMQNSKVTAIQQITSLWDNLFFGDSTLSRAAQEGAHSKSKAYFGHVEQYKVWEQLVSCLPVFVTVPVLIYVFSSEVGRDPLLVGALVATLPRTLQLFQNVHLATMYSSKFVLVMTKLRNLESFPEQLEQLDHQSLIRWEGVTVTKIVGDQSTTLSAQSFLARLTDGQTQTGRYLVTGANGTGKSSLLKHLKALLPEAVLMGVDIHLGDGEFVGSTGQKQMNLFSHILNHPCPIFLLDEWDASLDPANVAKIDEVVNRLAEDKLFIEVRH